MTLIATTLIRLICSILTMTKIRRASENHILLLHAPVLWDIGGGNIDYSFCMRQKTTVINKVRLAKIISNRLASKTL